MVTPGVLVSLVLVRQLEPVKVTVLTVEGAVPANMTDSVLAGLTLTNRRHRLFVDELKPPAVPPLKA